MTRTMLSLFALLTLGSAMPAHAQIDPYRPVAHATIGIYQDAAWSWGWERIGSWGWERLGGRGWERVGSWGWERVERAPSQPQLVGLVFVEQSGFGGATQHWAFFDTYDAALPLALAVSRYDYPDVSAYLGDMAVMARTYVPVTGGLGEDAAEPTCVTLTRGASDVADAHIKADEPDRSFGHSQSLTVSDAASGERRALLRFDTTAIPAGAIVRSAELSLSGLLYGGAAEVTAMLAPWDEASVTWSAFERAGAALGAAAGGAHLARSSATVPFTAAGATTTTNLGALVQAWVDGVIANHGVVLEFRAWGAQVVFASSESPTAALRPRLTVCYQAPEVRCAETCRDGAVCAAGACRLAEEPWADVLDTCLSDTADACGEHGLFANGRCFCDPGYTGDTCDDSVTCPDDCSGNGVCHLGHCFCEAGFHGDDCATYVAP